MPITPVLAIFLLVVALLGLRRRRVAGPASLPVIGSLHLLAGYSNPFEGFTALAKVYGDLYAIRLGSMRCVVVNNFALIKEVLIKKGLQFGGRPNYLRYHKLFAGDRNNSLALCDWSALQEKRRHIARIYCSPRFTSSNYKLLDTVSTIETEFFLAELHSKLRSGSELIQLKPLVLAACANMFTQYMCTMRFSYDNPSFCNIVRYYDDIFWDINQGYAVDFMPWLSPFYSNHMRKLSFWASEIRRFILANVVEEHERTIVYDEPPRNFTDALLQNLRDDDTLEWQHIMFELEDFLGGHSAVGNLVMLTLLCLMRFPGTLEKMRAEIDNVVNDRDVTLFDKSKLPYTEATIFETLRYTSSPIVPHVAVEDTHLNGTFIPKGTCVILNNYELNRNPDYWEHPLDFRPERFVKNGVVTRPAHFIPFGTGKRTCIGQQLVNGFSLVLVAGIVRNFDFDVTDDKLLKTKAACVALPPDSFPILMKRRMRLGF